MPSPNKKSRYDPRRTITPVGAYISVDALGFVVRSEHEQIADVRWSDVSTIFAYTRFIREEDPHLCLAFVLPPDSRGKEDQVVVNNRVSGWQELTLAVTGWFEAIDTEWQKRASAAASAPENRALLRVARSFTANPIKVWPTS